MFLVLVESFLNLAIVPLADELRQSHDKYPVFSDIIATILEVACQVFSVAGFWLLPKEKNGDRINYGLFKIS